MKRFAVVGFLVAVVFTDPAGARDGDLYKADPGNHPIRESTAEWRDLTRDRIIPFKAYAPADMATDLPVVIVSHGVGGSRDGLSYLGRHWASHGYLAVHLQHAGSDIEIWRGLSQPAARRAIQNAAMNPQAAADRPQDVRFAVDRLLSAALDVGTVPYSIDPNRIAVAGHSFGAFTALASAGVTFFLPARAPLNLGDDRLVASIALSPPAFGNLQQGSFASVGIPTLHMTGTKDVGVGTEMSAQERRNAYDLITEAQKYLVILDGGDHMVFGGLRPEPRASDGRHLNLIKAVTTAFLDSFVNGDVAARAWLDDMLPNIADGIAISERGRAGPDD
ncbi:MAG: hypothetical protein HQ495_14250 [Alphaproteobacteria bacterium]|nr:hypothetical protein [Alphaproteobacteria bacterium]